MSEYPYGIPSLDPVPSPTPDHRRRIVKEKAFEIVTVIVLILAGFGFLAWRTYTAAQAAAGRTIGEAAAILEQAGLAPGETATLMNREFHSFSQSMDNFTCHVDLIGPGGSAPLETLVAWLTPLPETWPPTASALQDVVDSVRRIAKRIVPSSNDALEKAVATSELLGDAPRPHDKGVAATTDGWKLTYVTYRSFDETATPQPVLVLILQRFSAGEDPALGDLNRTLFDAVYRGTDIKTALGSGAAGV